MSGMGSGMDRFFMTESMNQAGNNQGQGQGAGFVGVYYSAMFSPMDFFQTDPEKVPPHER